MHLNQETLSTLKTLIEANWPGPPVSNASLEAFDRAAAKARPPVKDAEAIDGLDALVQAGYDRRPNVGALMGSIKAIRDHRNARARSGDPLPGRRVELPQGGPLVGHVPPGNPEGHNHVSVTPPYYPILYLAVLVDQKQLAKMDQSADERIRERSKRLRAYSDLWDPYIDHYRQAYQGESGYLNSADEKWGPGNPARTELEQKAHDLFQEIGGMSEDEVIATMTGWGIK